MIRSVNVETDFKVVVPNTMKLSVSKCTYNNNNNNKFIADIALFTMRRSIAHFTCNLMNLTSTKRLALILYSLRDKVMNESRTEHN